MEFQIELVGWIN